MEKIKRKCLLLWMAVTIVLYLTAGLIVRISGQKVTAKLNISRNCSVDEIDVQLSEPIVEITGKTVSDGKLILQLESVRPGKAFLNAALPNGDTACEVIYVRRDGVITINEYLGRTECGGCYMFASAVSIALALVLAIRVYRMTKKECMYQYRCCGWLGLILFLSITLIKHLLVSISSQSTGDALWSLLRAGSHFSNVLYPAAVIMSVCITISNLVLLKREGFTWRNMLGAMLGITVCLLPFVPPVLEAILEKSSAFELHKENSASRYVMEYVSAATLSCLTYLECTLIGMIILGWKAARHIPQFNKDYILILGCKTGSDGKPTRLLQSRIDRAIEFAKMQQEKTGKALIFVPSGGKGADEVISEAACMKNYLIEAGLPESRILAEDRSESTDQNIRYSYALISEKQPDAEVALSTTNYHVFRAGALAYAQGHRMEGIGAKTRTYFWLNAFVREFIAVLYETKRMHITLIAYILTALAVITLVLYHAAQI